WQGGVIGAGAVAPAVTRSVGGGVARTLGTSAAFGQYTASTLVGGTQSMLGGGSFTEGALGGGLGWGGGQLTRGLPTAFQTGVPGKVVQAGVGAGVAYATGQDPVAGATGGLVGSFAKPPPAGGGSGGKPSAPKAAGPSAGTETKRGVGISP